MSEETDHILRLGRVEGRLDAMESRMGRHETYVGEQLRIILEKLDRALAVQSQSTTTMRLISKIFIWLAGASGWVALIWTKH